MSDDKNDSQQDIPLNDDNIPGRNGPFCRCLFEIENKKRRTKFCFMPCAAQITIIKGRESSRSGK
jgi:hypothetical protein